MKTTSAQPVVDEATLQAEAERLGSLMMASGIKLACAESCTGGWLAKVITDIPGSSSWFTASIVSYSNAAKQSLLNVSERTLSEHGAVSEAVVKAMCDGLLQQTDADLVISISGVAGPGGGSPEKPVGLVWFGWAVRGEVPRADCCNFCGDREAVRRQSIGRALQNLLALVDVSG